MVTARIAVKMAAPSAPREDALTEWVNVIAFTERNRHLLAQCEKGMLVAVSGNVTKEFYETRAGGRQESRTIIAEDIISVGGSLQPNVAHPADIDDDVKVKLADLVPEAGPETDRRDPRPRLTGLRTEHRRARPSERPETKIDRRTTRVRNRNTTRQATSRASADCEHPKRSERPNARN